MNLHGAKMCIIYVTYRTMLKYSNLFWGGNSLIASQIGQRETLDDLYRLTPSVLSRNETFPFSDRNDFCFKYSRPSLTLRNSSARCPPLRLLCRLLQIEGSTNGN